MRKIIKWVLFGGVISASLNFIYILGLGVGYSSEVTGRLVHGAWEGGLFGLILSLIYILCLSIWRTRAYGRIPISSTQKFWSIDPKIVGL